MFNHKLTDESFEAYLEYDTLVNEVPKVCFIHCATLEVYNPYLRCTYYHKVYHLMPVYISDGLYRFIGVTHYADTWLKVSSYACYTLDTLDNVFTSVLNLENGV